MLMLSSPLSFIHPLSSLLCFISFRDLRFSSLENKFFRGTSLLWAYSSRAITTIIIKHNVLFNYLNCLCSFIIFLNAIQINSLTMDIQMIFCLNRQSTVLVANHLQDLCGLMRDLPDYADQFLNMICKILQDYLEICNSAYNGGTSRKYLIVIQKSLFFMVVVFRFFGCTLNNIYYRPQF